jgi:predicted nucleotidyltransferase
MEDNNSSCESKIQREIDQRKSLLASVRLTLNNLQKLDEYFETYLKDCIKPSLEEVKYAKEKYQQLETLLTGFPIKNILLSGSFGRDTALHPLHDVDIVVVIDPSYFEQRPTLKEDFHQLFEIIFKKLTIYCTWKEVEPFQFLATTELGEAIVIRRQTCSIGVCWSNHWDSKKITFDIVPLIEAENLKNLWTVWNRKLGKV